MQRAQKAFRGARIDGTAEFLDTHAGRKRAEINERSKGSGDGQQRGCNGRKRAEPVSQSHIIELLQDCRTDKPNVLTLTETRPEAPEFLSAIGGGAEWLFLEDENAATRSATLVTSLSDAWRACEFHECEFSEG